MPFIGQEPITGAFRLLDAIDLTGITSKANFDLELDGTPFVASSARNLIVSLNGVTQAPETAFTVSGSTLTFTSNITSSDVIDYILVLGDVGTLAALAQNSVSEYELSYPLPNFSSTGIDDNATSTAITIDSSQNVGIGDTDPDSKLHVNGSFRQTAATVPFEWTVNAGAADYLKLNAVGYADNLIVANSSGSVGIGTPNPNGTTRLEVICPSAYGPAITVTDNGDVSNWSRLDINNSNVTGELIIYQDNGGHAAIRNTVAAGGMTFIAGSASNPSFFKWENEQGTGKMRLDSSGNLLVGTTNSSGFKQRIVQSANLGICTLHNTLTSGLTYDQLQVNVSHAATSAFFLARFYAGGTPQFGVTGNGIIYAQSTSVQSISDARVKENVRDSEQGLDVITALRPVRFDFKEGFGNDQKNQLGFIAQEVEAVFPDAVMTASEEISDEEPLKSLGPAALIPVMVKAIQEQQTIIEDLQTRLSALEAN